MSSASASRVCSNDQSLCKNHRTQFCILLQDVSEASRFRYVRSGQTSASVTSVRHLTYSGGVASFYFVRRDAERRWNSRKTRRNLKSFRGKFALPIPRALPADGGRLHGNTANRMKFSGFCRLALFSRSRFGNRSGKYMIEDFN